MKFHDKIKLLLLTFSIFLGTFVSAQSEFEIPDAPSKIYPVNDYANVLSEQQKDFINKKLITYSDSTSTEILVCTVKTINGDDINFVGARWGEKWKIGQKKSNNGIVLLIATDDHKLTIQNGRGTEDAMTDMMSGIIINQYMVPYLKENNFYEAINSGTDQIINVLQGKFKAKKSAENEDDFSGLMVAIIVFVVIMFIVFISSGGNNGGGTYYDRNGKRRKNDDDFWGGIGGGFLGGGFGSSRGGSSGGG